MTQWKVDKFIKDEKDVSNLPKLTCVQFNDVFENCDLLDNNFKLGHNDLFFTATSAMQKGNIKNKSGLIRCEFFEFLLRVCDEKYLRN